MDGVTPRIQTWSRSEWRIARARAIASKEPYCAICHKYIDVQAPMNDPDTGLRNPLAVEVDHIIPRARGGAMYEIDNLQLSHMICNRRKGAKMDSDYPDEVVANPVPWSNKW
jgi:5-methylcytosine-specific restriction endonuclease McrA